MKPTAIRVRRAAASGLAAAIAIISPVATEAAERSAASHAAGSIDEAPGFDGETITLALILPLTGPLQSVGEPVQAGYRAYIERLNEGGGVADSYPVELAVADSQYDPPVAVQKYNQLRDDVVMIGGVLGTPVVNALLEQFVRDDVVAAPLSFDATWIHEPNLIPVGTPLQARAALAVEWSLTEGGAEGGTVCALTADDPFGDASLEGVEAAARALGFEVAAAVTYRRGDTDFASQVAALDDAGCEVVFLGVTQNVTGPVIGIAAEQAMDTLWLGQTGSWTESLADSAAADYLAEHFYYVQEGPQWGDATVPSMVEFVEAWNESTDGAPADYYGILGWTYARAVHQILEEAIAGGDLGRSGIHAAVSEIDRLEFDGLTGDYRYGPPSDRQPPRTASIFRVEPDAPWGLEIVVRDYESDVAASLDL